MNDSKILKLIGRWFTTICVMLFNVVLLLALINFAVYALYTSDIRQTFEDRRQAVDRSLNWEALYPIEFLQTVYPDKTRNGIIKTANGFTGRGVVYEPYVQFKSEAGIFVGPRVHGENDPHAAARDATPSPETSRLALAGASSEVQREAFSKLQSWAIHEAGFRLIGPGQGPWPPSQDAHVVFVFGGSATAGSGVSDNETIAAYIQAIAREQRPGKRIDVYNFGTASHFLDQERSFFTSLLAHGIRPDTAIFIDGVLEFYHPDGKPGLTQYIKSLFFEERFIGQEHTLWWYLESFFARLPVVVWAKEMRSEVDKPNEVANQRKAASRTISDDELTRMKDTVVLDRIIARYIRNVRILSALGKGEGIDTFFVWQPTSLFEMEGPIVSAGYDPAMRRAEFGYKRMAEYISKNPMPMNFIWCAGIQKNIDRHMYLDGAHYTRWGSMRVADCILEEMKSKGSRLFGDSEKNTADKGPKSERGVSN